MPDSSASALAARELSISVPGRVLIEGLNVTLEAGELLAILGRNGSGKTLCLMTLCGLRPADSGEVRLTGQALEDVPRAQFARRVALLPQDAEDVFPSTVRETALIGRYPHIGRLSWESAEDLAIAEQALDRVGLLPLAGRDVLTLSGGERRRLAIAQVLAQQPAAYLLDEPTNHLDPQHQVEAMQLFRGLADAGAAVAASLHDVNLAARFADRCLLLYGDGRWALGHREEMLAEDRLSELYGTPMHRVSWRGGSLFVAGAA